MCKGITAMALLLAAGLSSLSASAAQLVWTESPSGGPVVNAGPSAGGVFAPIISGAANIRGPNGIEYFAGKLYWPDQQIGAVQRANTDGSGVESLVTSVNPYDVAVFGNNLYFAELNQNRIRVRDLSNPLSTPQDFLSGLDTPIAVDVTSGGVYFGEFNSRRVMRSNLDGTNVTSLFTLTGGAKPRDIEVTASHIYVADDFGNIRRADLNGGNLVTLATGMGFLNGIDVDVATNSIYWSNLFGGVGRTDLDGGNVQTIYARGFGDGVRGVALISAVPEPHAYLMLALGTLVVVGFARQRA